MHSHIHTCCPLLTRQSSLVMNETTLALSSHGCVSLDRMNPYLDLQFVCSHDFFYHCSYIAHCKSQKVAGLCGTTCLSTKFL